MLMVSSNPTPATDDRETVMGLWAVPATLRVPTPTNATLSDPLCEIVEEPPIGTVTTDI
jgi:hypothetical protein